MRRTTRARLWIATTLAIAAIAAAVLASPLLASSGESPQILVSAPASTDVCTPCHPTPAASRNPAVIFDHAAHLLVQCTACHVGAAHKDGATARPTMATCFACHGLEHGPLGQLASGTCADCHPAGFRLRPASHVPDWKEKPHAQASAKGVNGCLLCHDAPKDCDACHIQKGLGLPAMPSLYLNVLPKAKSEATVTVDPAAPVSVSQCAYCHSDIDGFSVDGLIFTHNTHLQRAYRCEACHDTFPHDSNGTQRLEMRSCMRCHGLDHGENGSVATGECAKCHPEGFQLVPKDHTAPFLSGEHKTRAKDDPSYCSQCHKPESCVECHNGGVKLANGTVGKKVVPADHKEPSWKGDHGKLYLGQKGMCVVCHTSEYCQQCHQTSMPHPATWLKDHAAAKGALAKDCGVCHTDREFCQDCHHNNVRSVALVPENCVGCHDEMKTQPATAIKVPGLAEHAVHFQVARPDKKGEPYYCDDCHIGFGSGGVHVTNPSTGPHDMRLCYECHGALDFTNRLIAPYRGAELCLRCHKDLGI